MLFAGEEAGPSTGCAYWNMIFVRELKYIYVRYIIINIKLYYDTHTYVYIDIHEWGKIHIFIVICEHLLVTLHALQGIILYSKSFFYNHNVSPN